MCGTAILEAFGWTIRSQGTEIPCVNLPILLTLLQILRFCIGLMTSSEAVLKWIIPIRNCRGRLF